ncbi:MAG: hypothetical protein ACRDFZ_08080 [Candidatus Limnocylindria bacterium]
MVAGTRRRVNRGGGVGRKRGGTRSVTAVDWLLASDEPAIRGRARRDLLGELAVDDLNRTTEGPMVQALLAGQQPDGGFGGHPYRKWTGAHWRLVSLVELEVPAGEPRAMAAAERVLGWLSAPGAPLRYVKGLPLSHGSIEGNGLGACSRLGLANDPRSQFLAESLVEWQWPDGGWNCDEKASGRRSSFHETLSAIWGLHEYATAAGNRDAAAAARRGAELLLNHRLFRRHGTGKPIHGSWLKLHYPAYWHYDILQALHVLTQMGLATDPRASDALDIVAERRDPDGRWTPGGYWWRPPGSGGITPEVVDWGRDGPSPMLTLNALRVLRAAGRLDGQGAQGE